MYAYNVSPFFWISAASAQTRAKLWPTGIRSLVVAPPLCWLVSAGLLIFYRL